MKDWIFGGLIPLLFCGAVGSARGDLDPEAHESMNRSFRVAARSGNVRVLEGLLNNGAQLNSETDFGETALHYSVLFGRVSASLWLIRKGAKVNTEDDSGRSPLTRAAADCNDRVVRALLLAGADVNHADYEGKTSLMYSADSTCVRSAAILLTQAKTLVDWDARDRSGLTATEYNSWMGEMIAKARLQMKSEKRIRSDLLSLE